MKILNFFEVKKVKNDSNPKNLNSFEGKKVKITVILKVDPFLAPFPALFGKLSDFSAPALSGSQIFLFLSRNFGPLAGLFSLSDVWILFINPVLHGMFSFFHLVSANFLLQTLDTGFDYVIT